MNHYDIIIIGGGMVGSLLSCLLKNSQLRVAIIEPKNTEIQKFSQANIVTDFDSRVSAITPLSKKIIASTGTWDNIAAQRHCAYTDMQVWEYDGTGELHFSTSDLAGLNNAQLGYMIENRIIQQALTQQSKENRNNVWWQTGLTHIERLGAGTQTNQAFYRLTLSNEKQLTTTLLIGADGALSSVRKQLGFEWREQSLEQTALVCTVKTEKPHNQCAYQIFHEQGPLAFLPLQSELNSSNGYFSSIVWSCNHNFAQQLHQQDSQKIADTLSKAIGNRLGNITEISALNSFPLINRHAYYVKDHAVLLGDAAHTVHPLAGQGVNLGFWDAAILAEEIINAINGKLPWYHDDVLRKFQRRRRWHNELMQQSFTQLNRLYQTDLLPLKLLRNIGVNFVNRTTPLKRLFMEQASGKLSDAPNVSVFV